MNYAKALTENLRARYSAYRQIHETKSLIKELEKSWIDINEECKESEFMTWFEFRTGGNPKIKDWGQIIHEWEIANPGWKVTRHDRIKKAKSNDP